jgi:hypothetical protein
MELQHVNVKLLAKDSQGFDLESLVPIFHAWIQNKVFDELLLDIADYRHVPDGPGIVLIGHQGDYAVDNTEGRLGVRYNRKTGLDGSNEDRFQQAARAALNAFQRLEAEPSLGGKLRFNGQGVDVFINDRMLAPNNEATRQSVEPELKRFFAQLFGGAEYSRSYPADPRRLFGVTAQAARSFSLSELLANLG